MNPDFDTLYQALAYERPDVSEQDLINALALVYMPRTLKAVVKVCKRFCNIVYLNSTIQRLDIAAFEYRYDVLRTIAGLKGLPDKFYESGQPLHSATPLWPNTGDGPLADLLMLTAEEETKRPDFARVLEWFVWFSLQYGRDHIGIEKYQKYLLDSSSNCRHNHAEVNRLYDAARYIRNAFAKEAETEYSKLMSLDWALDAEKGEQASMACAYFKRRKHIVYSHAAPGLSEQAAKALHKNMPEPLSIIVRAQWSKSAPKTVKSSSRSAQERAARKLLKSGVIRHGAVIANVTADDGDIAVELYLEPPDAAEPEWLDAVEEDEDYPPSEPDIQVRVLEDHNHIKAFYAAKGMQAHIETANALLPLGPQKISRTVLEELIRRWETVPGDRAQRTAQCLLLLALLTGRTLEELKTTCLVSSVSALKAPLVGSACIFLDSHQLLLKSGQPKLSSKSPEKSSSLLTESATSVSICLPGALVNLLGDGAWLHPRDQLASNGGLLSCRGVETHIRELLAEPFRGEKLSYKRLQQGLVNQLMADNQGDFGIVAVITNQASQNLRNVIHYASFSQARVHTAWAQAACTLFNDERCNRALHWNGDKVIGAKEHLSPEMLRHYFVELQRQISVKRDWAEWIDYINLLSRYTSLWLNLAIGGRARINPSPVALIDDWAVISDKHRADHSADRVVPLSQGLLAQLTMYVETLHMFSVEYPALSPIWRDAAQGIIKFVYLDDDGRVQQTLPEGAGEGLVAEYLPGNWARKLRRSEFTQIGERYLAAGLGHWVQGRHPYSYVSNLSPSAFRANWLLATERFEKEFKLELAKAPEVPERLKELEWFKRRLPVALGSAPKASVPANLGATYIDSDIEQVLAKAHKKLFNDLQSSTSRDPAAVLWLINKAVSSQASNKSDALELCEAACAYARREWQVNVHCSTPRQQMAYPWMIHRTHLINLSWFKGSVLGPFERDLEYLPDPADDEHLLGRSILLLMWKQHLLSWPILDAFLQAWLANGIGAAGNLRFVTFSLRCRRNQARMQRLAYLSPYLRLYLKVERHRLASLLGPLQDKTSQQRRSACQRALASYLKSLGVEPPKYCLSVIAGLAKQHVMLNAGPLLAAYGAAEFETHDLPEAEIRRLAGLPIDSPAIDSQALSIEGELEKESIELPSADHLPVLANLLALPMGDKDRAREIASQRPDATLESLLQLFARWLHEHGDLDFLEGEIAAASEQRYRLTMQVVGYGLAAVVGKDDPCEFDEVLMTGLKEHWEDFHAGVPLEKAFTYLRQFLRYRGTATAINKFGYRLGDLEAAESVGVLAKIVLPETIKTVLDQLSSAKCGIAKEHTRNAASRLLSLIEIFGLRRSEAEGLRGLDVEGDVIRVRPYEGHTLKTNSSNRSLPVEWLPEAIASQLDDNPLAEQLIAADGEPVEGYLFFDRLNKLLQRAQGDKQIHVHSIRHSLASRLVLALLNSSAKLSGIYADFEWLKSFDMPLDKLKAITGYGPNHGQGIQAVSALLGHSHPTTTLRYYVHTCGIAYYSALKNMDCTNVERSFERRYKSPATMRRWKRKKKISEPYAVNKRSAYWQKQAIAYIDPTEKCKSVSGATAMPPKAGLPYSSPMLITFERLEKLDNHLRHGQPNTGGENIEAISEKLKHLGSLLTGKKGSRVKRHIMDEVEGLTIPVAIAGGGPTSAADYLCEYLDQLYESDEVAFKELMPLWANNVLSVDGRVRLTQDQRVWWDDLPSTTNVRFITKEIVRRQKGRNDRVDYYGRIVVLDDMGCEINKSVSGVRWVMQYCCCLWASKNII